MGRSRDGMNNCKKEDRRSDEGKEMRKVEYRKIKEKGKGERKEKKYIFSLFPSLSFLFLLPSSLLSPSLPSFEKEREEKSLKWGEEGGEKENNRSKMREHEQRGKEGQGGREEGRKKRKGGGRRKNRGGKKREEKGGKRREEKRREEKRRRRKEKKEKKDKQEELAEGEGRQRWD